MKTSRTLRAALAGTAFVAAAAFGTNALAESPMCAEAQDDSWIPPEAAS